MNVTIRQLQCFAAVAKSGSFAEACTVLHLSQPALSIAIRNLEEALGGKLLARTTRAVALTPEGSEFYLIAQRLLADWQHSLEDVHNLFALRRGKLGIASMPTFANPTTAVCAVGLPTTSMPTTGASPTASLTSAISWSFPPGTTRTSTLTSTKHDHNATTVGCGY